MTDDIALYNEWLKGNQEAVGFILTVCHILHTYDDVCDGDKIVGKDDLGRAFWLALVDLPRNQFYARNFSLLNPILMTGVQNWHAANDMEASENEDDKRIAFIIRSSYVDILIMSATIIGGYDWGRQVTPAIRRYAHDETYDGYRKNLQQQFDDAARLGA